MNEEETQILHDVSRDALMEYTRGVSRWVRISSLQEEMDSLKYLKGLLDSFGYHTEMPEYMGYISYPVKAFVTIESPVSYTHLEKYALYAAGQEFKEDFDQLPGVDGPPESREDVYKRQVPPSSGAGMSAASG